LVKDKRGDQLVDPHKILNTWKNDFCRVLNVHGEVGVRQREMHTAQPLAPKPNAPVVEVATGKWKRFKSPGADKIPTKLIQMGLGNIAF
jgi:hypothetical protein